MANGKILDQQITSSSIQKGAYSHAARLYHQPTKQKPNSFWQPEDSDANPYLQIRFTEKMRIYGIATQGHYNREVKEFATGYNLLYYSADGKWKELKVRKVFLSNENLFKQLIC